MRTMLKSKIHRATVTEANIHYEGSITLDPELMDAAGILQYEMVHVLDVDNGARLETYTIPGPRGSRIVQMNGAAARLIQKGDKIIILSYSITPEEEATNAKPKLVYVNGRNEITQINDTVLKPERA